MAVILGSSVSVCQYRVFGDLPSSEIESWVSERLQVYGFKTDDGIIREKNVGWTTIDDMHDSRFDRPSFFLRHPYICFSLRKDERKIPAIVFRDNFNRECKNWLRQQNGLQHVPKGRKEEIKELVQQELLRQTLAVPSVTDVIWNTETNVVTLTTLNANITEMIEQFFSETFGGAKLVPIHPFARAEMIVPKQYRANLQQHNKASSDHVLDLIADNIWLGNDFLLWLIYHSLESSSAYGITVPGPAPLKSGFGAHIDHKILLSGEDGEGIQKVSITGPQTLYREVKTALKSGKTINEATIIFDKEEEVWRMTLKGGRFQFGSLKTPRIHMERDEHQSEEEELEAIFYEKMSLLESGLQMFDSLLHKFLGQRLDNKEWESFIKLARKWYNE